MADEVRLIDANAVCEKLREIIEEYERRIPDYSSNDVMGNGKKAARKWGNKADGIEKAISVINEAPTIEPEPVKHGRWCGTVCSNCASSDCNYFDHDYCPFCGARMDLIYQNDKIIAVKVTGWEQ